MKSKSRINAVATAIMCLTYGEMMTLGMVLAEMVEEKARTAPETPTNFASILHDWAEAQE